MKADPKVMKQAAAHVLAYLDGGGNLAGTYPNPQPYEAAVAGGSKPVEFRIKTGTTDWTPWTTLTPMGGSYDHIVQVLTDWASAAPPSPVVAIKRGSVVRQWRWIQP